MTYKIDSTSIVADIEKEISRAVSATDIYDLLKITSRDQETIEDYLKDAVGGIVTELFDIAKMDNNEISFSAPDFDASMTEEVSHALDRYLCFAVSAFWMEEKGQKNDLYVTRAQAMLNRAKLLLKSRKAPQR